MKFLIALFAVVAVASAQFELPTVVEGAKATLVGPSATLHADTGAIVKSGAVRTALPLLADRRLIAPSYLPTPLYNTRTISSYGYDAFPYTSTFPAAYPFLPYY